MSDVALILVESLFSDLVPGILYLLLRLVISAALILLVTPFVLLLALIRPGVPLQNMKRYYSAVLPPLLWAEKLKRASKTKKAAQPRDPESDDPVL